MLGTTLYVWASVKRYRRRAKRLLANSRLFLYKRRRTPGKHSSRWRRQSAKKPRKFNRATTSLDVPRERALRHYFKRRWYLWNLIFPVRQGPDINYSLIEKITLAKERRISVERLIYDRTQQIPDLIDMHQMYLQPPEALNLLGFDPKKIITDRQLVSSTLTLLHINNPTFGGSSVLYDLILSCYNVLRHEVLDTSKLSPSEIQARQAEDFEIVSRERFKKNVREMYQYFYKLEGRKKALHALPQIFEHEDQEEERETRRKSDPLVRQWKEEEIERIRNSEVENPPDEGEFAGLDDEEEEEDEGQNQQKNKNNN